VVHWRRDGKARNKDRLSHHIPLVLLGNSGVFMPSFIQYVLCASYPLAILLRSLRFSVICEKWSVASGVKQLCLQQMASAFLPGLPEDPF